MKTSVPIESAIISGEVFGEKLNLGITMEAPLVRWLSLGVRSCSCLLETWTGAKKGASLFSSPQSKYVKRVIPKHSLNGSVEQSDLHTIKQSSGHHVARLKARRYTDAVVRSVSEPLFEERDMLRLNSSKWKLGPVVIRYVLLQGGSQFSAIDYDIWDWGWSFLCQTNQESCVSRSTSAQKSSRSVKKRYNYKFIPCQECLVDAIFHLCRAGCIG